ncbi:MAG: 16S rRNA (adenine(1518)-N(6)/adenine(1519)-N(6))-dimethyltransferase RsmA [Planctomycetes bacterium]|nr:16S rRNA (adenine(1518)-N(6)/adenine(1519)-N(6))-dimethyltransferase RsmA [Planctomycetota bacterium]
MPKTRKELLPMLEAAGLKPRRGWGQSFLLDANMLDAIAREAEIGPDDLVLEIGTGPATLTEFLLERAGFVVSVEIDRGMAAFVKDALGNTDNLLLINADVMPEKNQLNLEIVGKVNELLMKNKRPLKVVANLPYSIASPLLIALLESELPIETMTLLFQLEVAERLTAKPGDDAYGLLTVLCALHADTKILRRVPNTCFWPKPKIESALVQVVPYGKRVEHYEATKHVASAVMRYRRKTLLNAAQYGLGLSKTGTLAWLQRADIDPTRHPGDLNIEEYLRLGAELKMPVRDET